MPGLRSLPLHDVPKLAQVGLRDGVVGFEPQRAQVVGLRLGEFPVQVEDGAEVHQRRRVLRGERQPKHLKEKRRIQGTSM